MGDPRPLLGDETVMEMNELLGPLLGRLAAIFADAETHGALRPGSPDERVHLFWIAVHGIVQSQKLRRFDPGPDKTPRLVGEICETLLLGWGAPPDLVEQAADHLERMRQPGAESSTP